MNAGREMTFFGRGVGSCVDVIFTSEHTGRQIHGWTVRTDVENMSDHYCLCFTLRSSRTPRGPSRSPNGQGLRRLGWKTDGMDTDLLAADIVVGEWVRVNSSTMTTLLGSGADAVAEKIVGQISAACDVAQLRNNPQLSNQTPVYW